MMNFPFVAVVFVLYGLVVAHDLPEAISQIHDQCIRENPTCPAQCFAENVDKAQIGLSSSTYGDWVQKLSAFDECVDDDPTCDKANDCMQKYLLTN